MCCATSVERTTDIGAVHTRTQHCPRLLERHRRRQRSARRWREKITKAVPTREKITKAVPTWPECASTKHIIEHREEARYDVARRVGRVEKALGRAHKRCGIRCMADEILS